MLQKTISQNYEAALDDLKKVNDDLFYKDLKNIMMNHYQQVESQIKENKEINNRALSELRNMDRTFEGELKNLSGQAEIIVQGQIENFEEHFSTAIEQLGNAYNSFQKVSDELEQKMADAKNDWNEILFNLTEDFKNTTVTHQQAIEEGFGKFSSELLEKQEKLSTSVLEEQVKLKEESRNYSLQVHETVEQFSKDYQDFFSEMENSNKEAYETLIKTFLVEIKGEMNKDRNENEERFTKIDEHSIKQEQLSQSILTHFQEQQHRHEEYQRKLIAVYKTELTQVKNELATQKKRYFIWVAILCMVQVLLIVGVMIEGM